MSEALQLYQRFYPNMIPTIFQQEMLEDRITNFTAWKTTLEFWAGNDYRPQSILKMLEYYEGVIQGKNNGANKPNGKRTDADVFKESADFYANYPEPIA